MEHSWLEVVGWLVRTPVPQLNVMHAAAWHFSVLPFV